MLKLLPGPHGTTILVAGVPETSVETWSSPVANGRYSSAGGAFIRLACFSKTFGWHSTPSSVARPGIIE